MRVVIAGGHGKIARHLGRLLGEAGHQPVGLIRNPDQVTALVDAGVEAVVLDLESATVQALATALYGADAAVFAAGAGPGSGPERKKTVDLQAAILLANACETAGVRRLVVVSSIGADRADELDDQDENGQPNVFTIYLRAKAAADAHVRDTRLDWTIVRPGGLTDDPATGQVMVAEHVPHATIPRADVAAVIAGCLEQPTTIGKQFELVSGDAPIAEALASL